MIIENTNKDILNNVPKNSIVILDQDVESISRNAIALAETPLVVYKAFSTYIICKDVNNDKYVVKYNQILDFAFSNDDSLREFVADIENLNFKRQQKEEIIDLIIGMCFVFGSSVFTPDILNTFPVVIHSLIVAILVLIPIKLIKSKENRTEYLENTIYYEHEIEEILKFRENLK